MSNADRIQDIAQKIYNAVQPFSALDSERADLKDALENKRKEGYSEREMIMSNVAQIAIAEAWTYKEVKGAVKVAAKMGNQGKLASTVAVFISEVSKAAHPLVRGRLTDLLNLRDEAWDAETLTIQADKTAARPLRKAFKRKYQMLTEMLTAIKDGTYDFTTAVNLIEWAEANDPSKDAKKIAERLEAIREKLSEFALEFPHTDIEECVRLLGHIGADELIEARDGVKPSTAKLASALQPAAQPPAKPTKGKPTTKVVKTIEPAMGVEDIDDLMNNKAKLALAAAA
jgi:hypothetical protein